MYFICKLIKSEKVFRGFWRFAAVLLLGNIAVASSPTRKTDQSVFLEPHMQAGQTLSDITYRVIALHGVGFDDRIAQMPATGTFTFQKSDDPSKVKWTFSTRIDGKSVIDNAKGEYRDDGKVMCFKDECNTMTDASSPFYNPTFWGHPDGPLRPGKSWIVSLEHPWELGPAGEQTITVVSVDPLNGIIVLKREGQGVGAYEGKHESTTVKKDGKAIQVSTRYGLAHWAGQAIFQRGVTLSDELLTVTPVEVTSTELGTIHAEERQYMSLLQHPEPISTGVVAPQILPTVR